jgi:uncharacterized protein (TIGR02996 family)
LAGTSLQASAGSEGFIRDLALERAVLADPADDAPRLVYADWLDEQGESDRAALIRVQVELTRRRKVRGHNPCECTGSGVVCKRCKQQLRWDAEDSNLLTAQARLQTQRNLSRWFPDVSLLASTKPRSAYRPIGHVSRGFIAHVSLDLAYIDTQMEAVFARHPVERASILGITSVQLLEGPEWLRSVRMSSDRKALVREMSQVLVARGRRLAGL